MLAGWKLGLATHIANPHVCPFGSQTQRKRCQATKYYISLSKSHRFNDVQLGASTSDEPIQIVAESCHTTRRHLLRGIVAVSLATQVPVVLADEEVKLPKEYRQLVKRLSEGLSESIETEASGASEAEVRRKADPAKDTVREFVRKWRDNPRVATDITHAEVREALAELGEFYMAYGQRTKLSPGVRESVLRHLEAAKAALPEEASKGGGKSGGGPLLPNLFSS